ncbi:MAG: hypothetical protein ACI4WF_02345 [Bacilli bacterium]
MIQDIITKIIIFLMPLENMYPEINSIIDDLNNYKYDSLNEFIKKYFSTLQYSSEFIQFITSLVDENIIDESYLHKVKADNAYTLTNINNLDILVFGSKPLNVTTEQFFNLKNDSNDQPDLSINSINDEEILAVEEDDIESLRKTILESQLNYLNNANQFIETLELESEDKIYHTLLNLNDIRYIQHCISNLSYDTLKRLLSYIELMEENKHNLINSFMEEAIKRSIHTHEKNI